MPVSTTARPAPLRRSTLVAGWSLIVLGAGHTATFAAGRDDDATRQALDGLERVTVAMPGPTRTLADLFTGYSLTMAALLVTLGALLVLLARYAEQAPGLLVAALRVLVVFTAVGLVLSWLFLPLPPLVGLSLALLAAIVGLVTARRRAGSQPSLSSATVVYLGPPERPAPGSDRINDTDDTVHDGPS